MTFGGGTEVSMYSQKASSNNEDFLGALLHGTSVSSCAVSAGYAAAHLWWHQYLQQWCPLMRAVLLEKPLDQGRPGQEGSFNQ